MWRWDHRSRCRHPLLVDTSLGRGTRSQTRSLPGYRSVHSTGRVRPCHNGHTFGSFPYLSFFTISSSLRFGSLRSESLLLPQCHRCKVGSSELDLHSIVSGDDEYLPLQQHGELGVESVHAELKWAMLALQSPVSHVEGDTIYPRGEVDLRRDDGAVFIRNWLPLPPNSQLPLHLN